MLKNTRPAKKSNMKKSSGVAISVFCGISLFILRLVAGRVFWPWVVLAAVLPGLITKKHGLMYGLCVSMVYALCEIGSIIFQSAFIDTRKIMYPSYLHIIVIIMLVSGFVLEKVLSFFRRLLRINA